MKESIQRAGSEVAIVIYDAPLPPKYFRLNKKFLQTLFVAAPVMMTLVFIGLFFWGLGSRLEDSPTPTFPLQLSEHEIKLAELQGELSLLKESNQKLTEKLTTQVAPNGTDDPYLMAIRKPYGMQNLTAKNFVTADQFDFVQDQDKAGLKFQIISTTLEHRVTGHVIVFMITPKGIMAYPDAANTQLSEGVKYSMGEPFAVSRLRPTNAVFSHQLSSDKVKFMIYIFSREGDLLMIKETQTFDVEKKK